MGAVHPLQGDDLALGEAALPRLGQAAQAGGVGGGQVIFFHFLRLDPLDGPGAAVHQVGEQLETALVHGKRPLSGQMIPYYYCLVNKKKSWGGQKTGAALWTAPGEIFCVMA